MAALLTSDQDNIDRIAIEAGECRDMGIEVLAPNVNESFEDFAVIVDETGTERIRFGFNAIKNVGHVVAHEIVEERKRNGKFKSLGDFLERVQTKDLNKKSIEALAKVGALDELGERNQIIESMENILTFSKNIQKMKNSNQESLFGENVLETPCVKLLDSAPASRKQKLNWEKELLGLYVSGHPALEYQPYIEKVAIPTDKLSKNLVGQKISVGGVILKIQKILTKNQQTMYFIILADTKGTIELLVFPKILERIASLWQEEKAIIATGRLSDKDDEYKLIVDDAKEINQAEIENYLRIEATKSKHEKNEYAHKENENNFIPNEANEASAQGGFASGENKLTKLVVTLPNDAKPEMIQELSALFKSCQNGKCKVFLHHQTNKLETPFSIEHDSDLLQKIKGIVQNGTVEIT